MRFEEAMEHLRKGFAIHRKNTVFYLDMVHNRVIAYPTEGEVHPLPLPIHNLGLEQDDWEIYLSKEPPVNIEQLDEGFVYQSLVDSRLYTVIEGTLKKINNTFTLTCGNINIIQGKFIKTPILLQDELNIKNTIFNNTQGWD